jgi:hypothetical protein
VVEQRFCKPLVGSSNLSPGTSNIKDLAQFPLAAYVAYVAIFYCVFQSVSVAVGNSVQHSRDMAGADQRTISSNSERVLVALDRALRTQMLGIAHLKTDKHPRNRPPTLDAALKRDDIAQFVAVLRALRPELSKKEINGRVSDLYGVKRTYVYKVLKELKEKNPERKHPSRRPRNR